jgi:hypothetical protein
VKNPALNPGRNSSPIKIYLLTVMESAFGYPEKTGKTPEMLYAKT